MALPQEQAERNKSSHSFYMSKCQIQNIDIILVPAEEKRYQDKV